MREGEVGRTPCVLISQASAYTLQWRRSWGALLICGLLYYGSGPISNVKMGKGGKDQTA